MNPALRTSAAHVIIDDIDVVALDRDDEHHLFRVMRLRDGETVTVTDGRGAWRRAEVDGRTLRAVGPVEREPEPRGCTIAAAIPKGDRLEWMVQKLTEALGVQFLYDNRGSSGGILAVEAAARAVREIPSSAAANWPSMSMTCLVQRTKSPGCRSTSLTALGSDWPRAQRNMGQTKPSSMSGR